MPRTARPPARRLITIDEAAKICRVHRATMRRRIADGRLTAYRVGDRLIRVDQAEVEKLLRPVPVTGPYGGNDHRARKLAREAAGSQG